MMKAADQLVAVLESWKVNKSYGLPGDSIDTTVDALDRGQDKIRFIQVRHEEVASLAAAADAKLTGNLGVCLSIGGPGAIHMLNGLYDAKIDHVPVLALVGQVASDSLNEGYFQEVETNKMFEDVSVFNKQVSSEKNLAELVDQAIRAAYEYQGVSILTIPDDIPDKAVRSKYVSSSHGFMMNRRREVFEEDIINKAKGLISQAKRPVALIGIGCKGQGELVDEFLTKNSIPFIATLPAKGIVGDKHPNYLGNVGKLGTKPAYEAMKHCDLLIMIGSNYPYVDYLPNKGQAKCIQINKSLSDIGKRYTSSVGINGDAKDIIQALNGLGKIRADDSFLKACQENMKQWNKWIEKKKVLDTKPISPEYLFSKVNDLAPEDTIYSIDVGTSTSWAARFLQVTPGQKMIISSYLGTMGCGLPGSISAKLNYPDRTSITFNGDGAFSMVMQDFVTAVKYHLPCINIVLNNQKLAFIEYEQQSAGQLNYQIDLKDIDFAKFAEACGGKGYTAHNNRELDLALKGALLEQKVPTLINVYTNDDAPLPGKIVASEAEGYIKFGENYLKKEKGFPDLPPLGDILKQFL